MRRGLLLTLALVLLGHGPAEAAASARSAARVPTLTPALTAPLGRLPAAIRPGALAPLAPSAPALSRLAAPVAAPAAVSAAPAAAVAAPLSAPRAALQALQDGLARLSPGDLFGQRRESALAFDGGAASADGRWFHPESEWSASVDAESGRLREAEGPPEDDGGGPDHPRRIIRHNGQEFPSVAFRPNDPVEATIVSAIDSARESLQIVVYEFTSRGILSALLRAKARGIKIEILIDDTKVNPRYRPNVKKQEARSEQIWALIMAGFDVRVVGRPTEYGINHNKFMVVDGTLAEYGSYNWTFTSERSHYENVLFTDEAARVDAYLAEFERLKALSVSVEESQTHEWPLETGKSATDASRRIRYNGIRLPAWIFTPDDEFEDSIAAAIDASKVSVDVAAFVFQSRRISDALERALARGLRVRIVADKSQTLKRDDEDDPDAGTKKKTFLTRMRRLGAQVRVLRGPGGEDSEYLRAQKMHNKFFIFDGKLVETGSANATTNAAVGNFENANYIDDKTDVKAFVFAFDHMFDVAESLENVPETPLPTDEELREGALKPRGPPGPPPPPPAPLPAARTFRALGAEFPVSAYLPNEPIEPHIIRTIDLAKRTLRVAMYELNQKSILAALRRAKERGVKVEVVLDRSHVYTTGYEDDRKTPRKPKQMVVDLLHGGFDVLLVKGRLGGIMHHKFVLADDEMVQYGSYNYTPQSEDDHYEVAFFTNEAPRVRGFVDAFAHMRELGEEVDFDKLDEVLARTEAVEEDPDDLLETEAAGGRRRPLPPPPPQPAETPIRLHDEAFPLQIFSPGNGAEAALIRAIEGTKATIDIAMFSFFSRPIAEALLRAKDRGVAVRIVMDRSQAGTSKLDNWFAWHGFDVKTLRGPDARRYQRYQKMHMKAALFDGVMLVSGSMNYSTRADTLNFENLNFFDETDEIARAAEHFRQMFESDDAEEVAVPRAEPTWPEPKSAAEDAD